MSFSVISLRECLPKFHHKNVCFFKQKKAKKKSVYPVHCKRGCHFCDMLKEVELVLLCCTYAVYMPRFPACDTDKAEYV